MNLKGAACYVQKNHKPVAGNRHGDFHDACACPGSGRGEVTIAEVLETVEIAEPVAETTAPVTEDSEELPPETTVGETVAETSAAMEPTAAETAPETVSETVPEETIAEEAVQESADVKNETYLQELLKGENKWPELYEGVVLENDFTITNTDNQLRAYATITVPEGVNFISQFASQYQKYLSYFVVIILLRRNWRNTRKNGNKKKTRYSL